MKFIHIISLVLSILWWINSPSWEPAVVTLGIIISFYTFLKNEERDYGQNSSKLKNFIIFALLIIALYFSNPSEDAHKAAILLSIDNTVAREHEKKNLGFNEECENSTLEIKRKISYAFKFAGQKYLNLGVISLSFSGRLISISMIGNIFILSNKDFQIIKEEEANHYLTIKSYGLAYNEKFTDKNNTIACRKVKNQTPEYVKSLEKSAKNGDAFSQWAYANALYDGDGIQLNKNKAYAWFLKSAKNGFSMSQFKVAGMLYFGEGVEKNEEEAISWLQKASDQGLPEAQTMLANILIHSKDKNNELKGFNILKKYVKEKGGDNKDVQFNLALCYYNGLGTSVDNKLAFEWFMKSANQEHAKAQLAVAKMYALGEGVEKDFSQFKKWIEKSANNGNKKAKELYEKSKKIDN